MPFECNLQRYNEVFDQFAECIGSLLRSLHAPVLPTLEPLLVQFVVGLCTLNQFDP